MCDDNEPSTLFVSVPRVKKLEGKYGNGEVRMEIGSARPPERLYRYYSPSGIETALFNNTLRWLLPCEENDPFEALARCWDKEAVREKARGLRPEDWLFLEGVLDPKRAQKKASHVAAFVSFSASEKSVLMWAHYAMNYTGACLEFDSHRLQQINCLKRISYVDPQDERPECPLLYGNLMEEEEYQKRVEEFLCRKSKDWSYEREWRLIYPPMVKYIGCEKDGEKFLLVSGIPNGAITKLIFGCNVPVSTRLAWAKRVLMNHPNCKFGEIVPSRRNYELEVEDLRMEVLENPSCQVST